VTILLENDPASADNASVITGTLTGTVCPVENRVIQLKSEIVTIDSIRGEVEATLTFFYPTDEDIQVRLGFPIADAVVEDSPDRHWPDEQESMRQEINLGTWVDGRVVGQYQRSRGDPACRDRVPDFDQEGRRVDFFVYSATMRAKKPTVIRHRCRTYPDTIAGVWDGAHEFRYILKTGALWGGIESATFRFVADGPQDLSVNFTGTHGLRPDTRDYEWSDG